ncbi:MAG: hypothetical protein LKJ66_05905 [Clostridium luticellarii]|nr:hypothetical protein [Clostridium luticellarii]MCI1945962.1 hypothetical protein [Clostridium luticellarii]MCI1996670.1 hypothetical protein [Clostridium luticellarii]MCI2039596.1 hypothetical protein [Clostridium luticellarii]
MMKFNKEELGKAIFLLSSTITKCEKIQLKFSEGTSQYSLLKNRIKALYISKALLMNDKTINYTSKELREALPPVVSIINKTTKAQSKYEKGTSQFSRFESIIQAMLISKAFIENQINIDSEL